MIHIYIAIGLAAVAAILGFIGHNKAKKTDLYGLYVDASRPSELSAGVPGFFGGTVALPQGTQPMVTPYGKQQCVWYKYDVEQQVSHRDANGTETLEWQTVSRQPGQGVNFLLQGQNGAVMVNPTNANVDHAKQYQGRVEMMNTQNQGGVMQVVGAIANASSNQRVTEHYIPLGEQLYAGGVTLDQGETKVFAADQSYPLVLTTQSKADLVKSGKHTTLIEYSAAGVLLAAAVAMLLFVKK